MIPRLSRSAHRGTRAALAAAVLLLAGLAGCASELAPRPSGSSTDARPYVGELTGEFADGRPLVRFPTIEVVGYRSSMGPGR
jgi:hypothetical protein